MPSSRLAKKESQKLLRQTVLYVVGAIALVLAFMFVVLPLFVRVVVGLSGGTSSLLQSDTVPPQVPIVSPPYEATPSANIALSGFGEPKSQVIAVVNGTEAGESTVSDDGQFLLDVALIDGENSVVLYAKDEAGNESATTNAEFIVRDATPPKLEVGEPQDGQTIELRRNQIVTVKGATDPDTEVTLNGRRVFAQADGNFTTTFQLSEGENTLSFAAEDRAGNTSTKEIIVTFKL